MVAENHSAKMDAYSLLGVSSKASDDEVRAAFRAMAMKWHPDRNLNNQDVATIKFIEINCAYRAIMQERNRRSPKKFFSKLTKSSKSTNATSSNAEGSRSHRDSVPPKAESQSTCSTDRAGNTDKKPRNASGSLDDSRPSSSSCHGHRTSSCSSSPSACSSECPSRARPGLETSNSSRRSRNSTPAASLENLATSCDIPHPSHEAAPSESVSSKHPPDKDGIHYLQRPQSTGTASSITSYSSSATSAYGNGEVRAPELSRHPGDIKPNEPSSSSAPHTDREPTRKRLKRHDSVMYKFEERPLLPEYDSPLARAVGIPETWTYTLRLTLEELFHGKKLRFKVIRCKLNGERKNVVLDVDVPPGTRHGTQIIFRGVGHERTNGTRQDMVFVVEELKHEKFIRMNDDLTMDVRLPWMDTLKDKPAQIRVTGIDGQESAFEIDFAKDGNVTGSQIIPDAGMPHVKKHGERGKLIVRWELYMPSTTTRWQAVKDALHL